MSKTFTDLAEPLQERLIKHGGLVLRSKADGEEVKEGNLVVLPADKTIVCRIYANNYGTVALVRKKYRRKLEPFLKTLKFPEAMLDEELADKILDALEIDKNRYPYRDGEKSEGRHGCVHSTEWVCTRETFQPYESPHEINIYHREDVGWRNVDEFDDKLFRVMSGTQVAGFSGCRESRKSVMKSGEKSYVVQVGTHAPFRNRGIGKATATANVREILDKDGVAWGDIKAENAAAVSVARSLGFVFTGGELTIR